MLHLLSLVCIKQMPPDKLSPETTPSTKSVATWLRFMLEITWQTEGGDEGGGGENPLWLLLALYHLESHIRSLSPYSTQPLIMDTAVSVHPSPTTALQGVPPSPYLPFPLRFSCECPHQQTWQVFLHYTDRATQPVAQTAVSTNVCLGIELNAFYTF